MMAIRNKIKLAWDGEEYEIIITMRHIDQIEDVVNLTRLSADMSRGDLRYSHAAKLIATVLQLAGCKKVTQEDVYNEMFAICGAEGKTDPVEVTDIVNSILDNIFYIEKKPQSDTTKTTKKGSRSKGIRGKSNTK